MNISELPYTSRLEPNVRLLENAIKANYILSESEDSEIMEASKASEGSKSAPQLIMVLFGHRMGFSDVEIQHKFGISDKMLSSLWDRVKALLLLNDQEFIRKIKLCENYLRLMAKR